VEFLKTAVLGVGLIGASLAGAMKGRSLTGHVTGFGRRRENLERAVEKGFIDSFEMDPGAACRDADLVVFATPVETFSSLAGRVSAFLKKGAVVIDVGSVKGLVRELEGLMPGGVSFVGCHPIAGSERSGVGAAEPGLFEGALCIITKTERTDAPVAGRVKALWEAVGSRVEFLGPEEHDRLYGLVSHFIHLAAYALVNAAGDVDSSCMRFAGPGFRDTTRIALSDPALWSNICAMNRDNMLTYIEVFRENLGLMEGLLRAGDREGLEKAFRRARQLREGIGD